MTEGAVRTKPGRTITDSFFQEWRDLYDPAIPLCLPFVLPLYLTSVMGVLSTGV